MLVPKWLKGVGYIRVLAALATFASVLLHNVFIVPGPGGYFGSLPGSPAPSYKLLPKVG